MENSEFKEWLDEEGWFEYHYDNTWIKLKTRELKTTEQLYKEFEKTL